MTDYEVSVTFTNTPTDKIKEVPHWELKHGSEDLNDIIDLRDYTGIVTVTFTLSDTSEKGYRFCAMKVWPRLDAGENKDVQAWAKLWNDKSKELAVAANSGSIMALRGYLSTPFQVQFSDDAKSCILTDTVTPAEIETLGRVFSEWGFCLAVTNDGEAAIWDDPKIYNKGGT